jgi:assimilatory nitrate reductase catalytic subunit
MGAVHTTCPYCGVGCGVRVTRSDSGIELRGDPQHPANRGRLCSKGTALGSTVGLEGRLLEPRVDGRVTDWDEALERVASGFADCIRRHGPDSVALYVSGQLLTEDYYVANKLAKGYLGTANIDTNSRLCMASAVTGHQRAFGEDLVPVTYDDLESAELIVLVGSNTAWCHPVLMQRINQARELRPGMRLVVIDPRRTATCDGADLHLPLRAGTDVLLFNGLLAWLADHGHADAAFVAAHTGGLQAALDTARIASSDVAATAQACGLEPALVQRFFELFAGHARVVTAFSQGVNQSSAGTDKVNAIINCHLLTGRIGRPGAGPFSLTGQPNAMGGREVGGLATQLAAHLSLEDARHRAAVQAFWGSPRIAAHPGLKAVELFDAIDAGRIKAVWIIATNPVVSLPDADVARRALQRCELVVVSDCIADTDTTRLAHVLLPASAWGEKDGTVTNSERVISRQRPFLPAAGEARPDWWIIGEVARRMGFGDGFAFTTPAQIFDEHARLTAVAAGLGRRLDLSGLAGLEEREYAALQPRRWPVVAGEESTDARLFEDGCFPTPDGRARFVPTAPRAPRHPTTDEFPLVLNTGRVRDQWHTMTRTARAPQLNAHEPEPYIDLHADDARVAGLTPGALAQLVTRWGRMVARVRCSGDQAHGTVFAPMHWNDRYASHGRVNALVNPVVDASSGEPEFKHTPARVEPYAADWHGFLLTRAAVTPPKDAWWALAPGTAHLRYELAGRASLRPGPAWFRDTLGAAEGDEILEYEDERAGVYRAALLRGGRLEAALLVGARSGLPPREWLGELFAGGALGDEQRNSLLTARAPGVRVDPGPTVCACFRVGSRQITSACEEGHTTLAAIGQCLRAGTNCGSCRPEIARLLTACIARGTVAPAVA